MALQPMICMVSLGIGDSGLEYLASSALQTSQLLQIVALLIEVHSAISVQVMIT